MDAELELGETDSHGHLTCDACQRDTKPEILADLCTSVLTPGVACAMRAYNTRVRGWRYSEAGSREDDASY